LLWLHGFTGREIILVHCIWSAQGAGPFHYDLAPPAQPRQGKPSATRSKPGSKSALHQTVGAAVAESGAIRVAPTSRWGLSPARIRTATALERNVGATITKSLAIRVTPTSRWGLSPARIRTARLPIQGKDVRLVDLVLIHVQQCGAGIA